MNVKLISITKPEIESVNTAEELVSYCARVSNPSNQLNLETSPKLLAYLIKHKHWSPFEMVSMTLEINTTRSIAAQILRHRSFAFQEFSQRYSTVTKYNTPELRKQSDKNRQSSVDIIEDEELKTDVMNAIQKSFTVYEDLIKNGVARECAREVLPLCTQTTMYMSGTIRSWIHYIDLRTKEDTQKEHREIALECKTIFNKHFPSISSALNFNQ